MDPAALFAASARLNANLEAVAQRLRQITVRVRNHRVGEGSGVIWNADGLIVSNAHVALGEPLAIELWDGRRYEAELIRRDSRRDLALLAIPAAGLPEALPGDTRLLRPGQLVLALGHPIGLPHAVALGVIHDLSDGERSRWVRADIRLAPGNSGGPLANTAGEVIGINTLVAGGLGHAVATGVVQRFLLETGARAA